MHARCILDCWGASGNERNLGRSRAFGRRRITLAPSSATDVEHCLRIIRQTIMRCPPVVSTTAGAPLATSEFDNGLDHSARSASTLTPLSATDVERCLEILCQSIGMLARRFLNCWGTSVDG